MREPKLAIQWFLADQRVRLRQRPERSQLGGKGVGLISKKEVGHVEEAPNAE